MDVVYRGLDYAELTRFFLWDKVARAVRHKLDPEAITLEVEWLQRGASRATGERYAPRNGLAGSSLRRRFRDVKRRLLRRRLNETTRRHIQTKRQLHRKPVIYAPTSTSRTQSLLHSATEADELLLVENEDPIFLNWDERAIKRDPTSLTLSGTDQRFCLYPSSRWGKQDRSFARALYRGMLRGLQQLDVTLVEADAQFLQSQISAQPPRIDRFREELRIIGPDAIVLYADNHPPFQEYVLLARQMGIPSIMIQHGLDCENHCLDNAYASDIAVWSETRLRRYQNDSQSKPRRLHITGNPEFDPLAAVVPDAEGEFWLWMSRPHEPQKCFSPSRFPQEGLEIFRAILGAVGELPNVQLVVKPHPFDFTDLYEAALRESVVKDRVKIVDEPVRALIPHASVVVSEDSTAGMEAMFWGKRLVHAHFASSPPVLPFVAYDAALPGFSPDQLRESLRFSESMNPQDVERMQKAQQSFLEDYAGPCDGQSAARVLAFIAEVLDDSRAPLSRRS